MQAKSLVYSFVDVKYDIKQLCEYKWLYYSMVSITDIQLPSESFLCPQTLRKWQRQVQVQQGHRAVCLLEDLFTWGMQIFNWKIAISLLLVPFPGGRHYLYDNRQQASRIFVLVVNIISHCLFLFRNHKRSRSDEVVSVFAPKMGQNMRSPLVTVSLHSIHGYTIDILRSTWQPSVPSLEMSEHFY